MVRGNVAKSNVHTATNAVRGDVVHCNVVDAVCDIGLWCWEDWFEIT